MAASFNGSVLSISAPKIEEATSERITDEATA